jgi:peptidoglycan lytic transglycosylase G
VARGRKQKDWRKITLITIVVLALVAIGSVLLIRRTYNQNLRPVSTSQKSVVFTVPEGASVRQVAASLQQEGLIRASWAFEWYFRTNSLGDLLKAGTYSLRPDMSVKEIADIITEGTVTTNQITILPGRRIDQLKTSLINSGFSVADVEAALKPSAYANHPALVDKPVKASLEGYIFPETFQKTATTKPQTIIKASLDELNKVLTPKLRADITRQGLTVHEGIILASIVEKETGKEEDKPVIAQVFLRRLREGHRLQSDATAGYGAVLNGEIDSLTGDQILSYDSPYNTYANDGLPPGPISNFNKSSLEAVAKPANSNYLYFVAGEDCVTRFSHTLEEHNSLIQQHGVREYGAFCS